MQITKQYQYQPNLLGKHLRTKETRIILVLLTTVANSFSSKVIAGIDEEARANGYHILVCITNDDRECEESYLNLIRNGLADGAIIMNSVMDKDEMHAFAAQYCVVQCNEYTDTDTPYVTIDNEQAAYDAVKHLISLGRRKIAYCGVKNHFVSSHLRYQGYVRALEESGISLDESLVFDANYSFRSALKKTKALLSEKKCFDAVFSISDRMAAGVITALKEEGITVPHEVSVIGFDNIDLTYMITPTLTTVSQPRKELGIHACREVLHRIRKEPVKSKILNHKLIIRNSTEG